MGLIKRLFVPKIETKPSVIKSLVKNPDEFIYTMFVKDQKVIIEVSKKGE